MSQVDKEVVWCWGISKAYIALYMSVTSRVKTVEGASYLKHSTIGVMKHSTRGVKQGYPLSSILFSLYIDEVSDFIDKGGRRDSSLAGVWIQLLIYADNNCIPSRGAL